MYYVCIEDRQVTTILNYEPNVPESVTVVTITIDEYDRIANETHYFDVDTETVIEFPTKVTDRKKIEVSNRKELEFLNKTDWKVLRHIRQKSLDIPTTLTEEEYLELENQRNIAAQRVVDIE